MYQYSESQRSISDWGAHSKANSDDLPIDVEVKIGTDEVIRKESTCLHTACDNASLTDNSTDMEESCNGSHGLKSNPASKLSYFNAMLTSTFARDSNKISSGKSASTNISKAMMNDTNPVEVDKMLLDELQGLSVADRGVIQEEIHGVATCAITETEDKIREDLKLFDEEISRIYQEVSTSPRSESRSGKTYADSIWAYLAVAGDNAEISRIRLLYSFIFHRDFRLRFLRADFFDVEKAAHRYLRAIEGLLKYYGTYALQRSLLYEDLGKDCQDAFKAGYVQILPSRDRSGRLVVVCQECLTREEGNSMGMIVKLFTYVFFVVSEDTETQKRGVIFVFNTGEKATQFVSHPVDRLEYSMYREGSPVRRSCTHFCLPENNQKMRLVRAVMMLAMPREERVRTRIHMDGLTMETQYKLMTFGIPVAELPITSTGAIKLKYHSQWIKTRKALDFLRMKSLERCCKELKMEIEGYTPTYDEFLKYHGKEPIMYPMINDVLFSKGGKNVTHYGNIEFTDLMKRCLMEYISTAPIQNRKVRKAIRQSIVTEIQSRGGRFLTLDKKFVGGCCWIEIQEGPGLHDRIATSLYDHKRRLAAKMKVKDNRCSTGVFLDNTKRQKIMIDGAEPNCGSPFCRP